MHGSLFWVASAYMSNLMSFRVYVWKSKWNIDFISVLHWYPEWIGIIESVNCCVHKKYDENFPLPWHVNIHVGANMQVW